MTLRELVLGLRESIGLAQKKDIRLASERLAWGVRGPWGDALVELGDDCAAIPDGDGHLLFAIEGISPELVRRSPRAAGYCSVLVNASDVYAMGGRPLAVVDALFSGDPETAHQILDGMNRAASRLGIPVVGGHTNLRSPYAALAVAIVGRSRSLITSFDARPGDDVIVGIDLRGKMVAGNPFWDATDAPPVRMREDYELLPKFAEARLVRAGKDISMAGVVGSLLMLIESSRVGANLALDRIPRPPDIDLARWLAAFPSYGFVLAVEPSSSDEVTAAFSSRGIASAVVGSVDASRTLTLSSGDEREVVWDLGREGLTQAEGTRSRHA